jgi:hypothetical protein
MKRPEGAGAPPKTPGDAKATPDQAGDSAFGAETTPPGASGLDVLAGGGRAGGKAGEALEGDALTFQGGQGGRLGAMYDGVREYTTRLQAMGIVPTARATTRMNA